MLQNGIKRKCEAWVTKPQGKKVQHERPQHAHLACGPLIEHCTASCKGAWTGAAFSSPTGTEVKGIYSICPRCAHMTFMYKRKEWSMCNEIADHAERACNSLSLCQRQSKGMECFFLSPSLNNSLPELTEQEPCCGYLWDCPFSLCLISKVTTMYLNSGRK